MLRKFLLLVLLLSIVACGTTYVKNTELVYRINKHELLKHFKELSLDKYTGREVGTDGNLKAQHYIKEALKADDISPFNETYIHPFCNGKKKDLQGSNIIGFIQGKGSSNRYIVLTAHYDHIGTKNGKIYNGADDNASGVSALISLASYLNINRLNNNVILLFTDGEESQLAGSKQFIKENKVLTEQINLSINMDMLAGSKQSKRLHYIHRNLSRLLSDKELATFERSHSVDSLKTAKNFSKAKYHLNKQINWLKASDHASFHKMKIPFIYYGVGTHKNYHSTRDRYENTNHDLLYNSTNLILQQLIYLDTKI